MTTPNYSGNVQLAATIDGAGASSSMSIAGAAKSGASLQLPAAFAGDLSTHSTNTTGVVTAVGHGLTGGETLALFWGPGPSNRCYGATITAHDANTFTITVPHGASLPAQGTPLLVAVAQTQAELNIDGAALKQILATASQAGLCVVRDSGDSHEYVADILAAGGLVTWPHTAADLVANGGTLPFSTVLTTVDMYNNSLLAAAMSVTALM